MMCVRCKLKESIEEEKICKYCLIELKRKFHNQKYLDVLDNPEVKRLIKDYEKAF